MDNECMKFYMKYDTRSLIQCVIDFLDSSVGRDKLCRLFQYFTKFILPFIKDKKDYAKVTQFLESFSALCSLVRKVNKTKSFKGALISKINKSIEKYYSKV